MKMAGNGFPGPLCKIRLPPRRLDDGTLCRCESPLPGPLAPDLSAWEHFTWGEAAAAHLGQERWFETRYPNLLEDARIKFVREINGWVERNWGQTEYDETSPRIRVHGRNKYKSPANRSIVWTETLMRDDRFQDCGDLPQSFHEADAVVGSYALDIVTPVAIAYMKKTVNGQIVDAFEWTATLYVEDTMGVQARDRIAFIPGVLTNAPSRRVRRASWTIGGEGYRKPAQTWKKHWVISGDTLSLLAQKYYGDIALWPILYKFNAVAIGPDQNNLRVGLVLEIPELSQLSPDLIRSILQNAPPAAPQQHTVTVQPPL